jgi:uncharacterized MAPEG superfamily protein
MNDYINETIAAGEQWDQPQPRPTPVVGVWCLAVLINTLKIVGIAQLTGIARVATGSFATREDYELMASAYGPPPEDRDAPLDPFGTPVLRRLAAVHRNEVEIVPLFCALSYAYTLSAPPLREACALLFTFTLARLAHTALYVCACSPWRSLAWGVATQALLIMAGRLAAWLYPAASISLQLVINAPIALQWLVSLGVLGTVREQGRRIERARRVAERRRRGLDVDEVREDGRPLRHPNRPPPALSDEEDDDY